MLRHASADDAAAIARLHNRVWRNTFEAMAPAEAFRLLGEEDRRLAAWQDTMANPRPDQAVLVIEHERAIVGMGAAAAPSAPIYGGRGEIRTLYVDQDFQGQGFGRRLMGALSRHLADKGYTGAALSVVSDNVAAIAFYERLGGRVAGTFTDPGPIWRSNNVLIVWDDLSALLRLAP